MKHKTWKRLTLSDKTLAYFQETKFDRVAQARYWNDWQAAFDWFERTQCE